MAHFSSFPPLHGNRRRLLDVSAWLRARGLKVVFILQPQDMERADIPKLADVVDEIIMVHDPRPRLREAVHRWPARAPVLWRLNRWP
jgi:hypothetical protein